MRTPSRYVVAALLAALPAAAFAEILFFEDFQTRFDPETGEPVKRCTGPGGAGTYPFPAGWLLRNVDNRTPDAQVAYVNEAWEVREDFASDVTNCAAFSTSYYSPVGSADDWMWTPLIGPLPVDFTRLRWRARTYDPSFRDGYEVRIMPGSAGPPSGGTGILGNQVANSTLLLSIAAEEASWTTRTVDLGAYAGQTVYIGFRNNSNDKFLLLLDDILVESLPAYDPELHALQATSGTEYAEVPAWFGQAVDLEATVRNNGAQPLGGVTVLAEVQLDGQPVDALESAPAILPIAAETTVDLGSVVLSAPGQWLVSAVVVADQGDQEPANSVQDLVLANATADTLRRADGSANGQIGIGNGTGGELGTDFSFPLPTVLRRARFTLENSDTQPAGPDGTPDFNGYTLQAVVRDFIAGQPGDAVGTATTTVPQDAAPGLLDLEFDFGDLVLPPGRYLLALQEPTEPEPRTLTLQLHPGRYTAGTNWVIWPGTGGWANLESYSVSFQRALAITAVVRAPLTVPVAEDDAFSARPGVLLAASVAGNDTPSDDGGNTWTLTSAPPAGSFTLQPNGDFSYAPDPALAGSVASFGYQVCDTDDDCDQATATITVLPFRIFADSFEPE